MVESLKKSLLKGSAPINALSSNHGLNALNKLSAFISLPIFVQFE